MDVGIPQLSFSLDYVSPVLDMSLETQRNAPLLTFSNILINSYYNTNDMNLIMCIVLYYIFTGEGSFGRVWSGKWGRNDVAVKEFVFAQVGLCAQVYVQYMYYICIVYVLHLIVPCI